MSIDDSEFTTSRNLRNALDDAVASVVPESVREQFGPWIRRVGIAVAVLILLATVYILLHTLFYLVAPYVGVHVKSNQYTVATRILMFIILALTWDLIGGQTGYTVFGNLTFFGIGAYTDVILMKGTTALGTHGFVTSVVVAAVVGVLYALILGIPLLRLRGHYFAVSTLGVLIATRQYVANLAQTGGGSGVSLPLPGFGQIDRTFYLLFLALTVITVVAYWYLTNTRFVYGLNAIRDDESKARAMGIETTKYKITAWCISAFFFAIAGAIFAYQNSYISPGTAFSLNWSIFPILMALVGGMGRLWGSVIGAAFLWDLRNTLWSGGPAVNAIQSVTGISLQNSYLVVFGIILVLIVIGLPEGILGYLDETGVLPAIRNYVSSPTSGVRSNGGDRQ